MSDMEKVIEDFENLLNAAKGNYQDFVDLTVDGAEEVLALLKDQGAKPPRVHENAYGRKFYHCPRCNRTFDYFNQESYCHDCGQAVKWE